MMAARIASWKPSVKRAKNNARGMHALIVSTGNGISSSLCGDLRCEVDADGQSARRCSACAEDSTRCDFPNNTLLVCRNGVWQEDHSGYDAVCEGEEGDAQCAGDNQCVNDATRCLNDVRQRCVNGLWGDDPCADNQRCELEGECVVADPCLACGNEVAACAQRMGKRTTMPVSPPAGCGCSTPAHAV